MSELYPLLLIPIFDERPWGVRDLRPIYSQAVKESIGESWLTWQANRIANGPLTGRTLGELAKQFRRGLVGSASVYEDRFPLLVKFLFPREKLSVQVHPDDQYAKQIGELCGKTECWYVLKADRGAQVALGLKSGVTIAQLESAIHGNNAEKLLNWITLHEGDMIYVDAGTVHTIGGGSILVETQQTSDTTYRLYDYARPRELHIAEGLAAVKLKTSAGKVVRQATDPPGLLVRAPYFQVEELSLREPLHGRVDPASPHVLVAIAGSGVIESPGVEPISFAQGEGVVVPAAVREYGVRPQWDLKLMRMSVPPEPVPVPETTLEESVSAP